MLSRAQVDDPLVTVCCLRMRPPFLVMWCHESADLLTGLLSAQHMLGRILALVAAHGTPRTPAVLRRVAAGCAMRLLLRTRGPGAALQSALAAVASETSPGVRCELLTSSLRQPQCTISLAHCSLYILLVAMLACVVRGAAVCEQIVTHSSQSISCQEVRPRILCTLSMVSTCPGKLSFKHVWRVHALPLTITDPAYWRNCI